MHLKDHYAILQVEPSATLQEIKKAYRKLAHQYHPDKHPGDPYATAQFAEVKEAYEVLTDPSKKEYYLQQRWYEQSMGKRTKQDLITPVTVLKQALELEKYVSKLDVFRMDKEGLRDYILGLVPDSTVEKLLPFREPDTIGEIISVLLRSVRSLPRAYTDDIFTQLQKLGAGLDTALTQIEQYRQKTLKRHRREKYSLITILLITVILVLLIWLAGH